MPRSKYRLIPAAALLVLATGCAAGQVSQTNNQTSTVDGVAARVGDIAVRAVRVEYPSSGSYPAGDSARLEFTVVNENVLEPDALIDVSSPAFDGEPDSAEGLPIDLPTGQDISFQADGITLELTDLSAELLPSVQVEVTFVFQNAGAVTVRAPVAVPMEYQEAEVTPFDFHAEQPPVTDEQPTG